MTERRWTASSRWMMTYEPDYLTTANFFGNEIGIIDFEIYPHTAPNGDELWEISFTYLRQDAERFGELLWEFDRLTESGQTRTIPEAKTVNDKGNDYDDLPF